MKNRSAKEGRFEPRSQLANKTRLWMRLIKHELAILMFLFAVASPAIAAQRPPLVIAAASLQESLTAAAKQWAALGHPEPIISFAASSALARQIEAGAPADLFISADQRWMDELPQRNLLLPGRRSILLAN